MQFPVLLTINHGINDAETKIAEYESGMKEKPIKSDHLKKLLDVEVDIQKYRLQKLKELIKQVVRDDYDKHDDK